MGRRVSPRFTDLPTKVEEGLERRPGHEQLILFLWRTWVWYPALLLGCSEPPVRYSTIGGSSALSWLPKNKSCGQALPLSSVCIDRLATETMFMVRNKKRELGRGGGAHL